MTVRPGSLLMVCSACLGLILTAQPACAAVKTTTAFGPPTGFGYVLDGAIFPDSPYAARAVLEVRVYWDVVVAAGYNAANIDASVLLPIYTNTPAQPWPLLPAINLDGGPQGWTGSGTFNYTQTINGQNMSFGPHWTFWTHQALYTGGGPGSFDAVQVLPTSRIEIDYIDNIPGDSDDDGDIDDADLATSFANYSGPIGRNAQKTFLNGDTDGDGDVDDSDLATLFVGYTGPQPAPVPEPASAGLLGLAAAILVNHRRRD